MAAQRERSPPPDYAAPSGAVEQRFHSNGFPSGYFIIRSIATGRLLDVSGSSNQDGSEVVLWPEKDGSLVHGLRSPSADNQVFYMDHTGALCSKSSGHAIDVQDGRLVLRHRRPVVFPFPNSFSHPLPQFSYRSSTGNIRIIFTCDPLYPDPGIASPSTAWRSKDYLLSSMPLQKQQRSAVTDVADFFSSAASAIVSPFAGPSSSTSVPSSDFELQEDEVVAEERADDEDWDDDSSENGRLVRVIGLPVGWQEKGGGGGSKTRERRRWEVVPLLIEKSRLRKASS